MQLLAAFLGLVFFIAILGVIVWGVRAILAALSPWIAEPFNTIIYVVLVVVMVIIAIYICIWLLNIAGVHVNMPHIGATGYRLYG